MSKLTEVYYSTVLLRYTFWSSKIFLNCAHFSTDLCRSVAIALVCWFMSASFWCADFTHFDFALPQHLDWLFLATKLSINRMQVIVKKISFTLIEYDSLLFSDPKETTISATNVIMNTSWFSSWFASLTFLRRILTRFLHPERYAKRRV